MSEYSKVSEIYLFYLTCMNVSVIIHTFWNFIFFLQTRSTLAIPDEDRNQPQTSIVSIVTSNGVPQLPDHLENTEQTYVSDK